MDNTIESLNQLLESLEREIGALKVESQAMSENRIKLRFGVLETRRVRIGYLELYKRFCCEIQGMK